jgi:DNA-binding IclR family transcriptional regulator
MPRGARNARWPAILFLLTKGPRTAAELVELAHANPMTVSYVLGLLESEGLVRPGPIRKRPAGGRGRDPQTWEWAA